MIDIEAGYDLLILDFAFDGIYMMFIYFLEGFQYDSYLNDNILVLAYF